PTLFRSWGCNRIRLSKVKPVGRLPVIRIRRIHPFKRWEKWGIHPKRSNTIRNRTFFERVNTRCDGIFWRLPLTDHSPSPATTRSEGAIHWEETADRESKLTSTPQSLRKSLFRCRSKTLNTPPFRRLATR